MRVDGERVWVDGSPVSASLVPAGKHHYSLILDGVSHDVILYHDGTAEQANVDGTQMAITVKDSRKLLLEKFGARGLAKASVQDLRAPMPGLVLRVSVECGDVVQKGQTLLVLEAMKMENELRSPTDGVVRRIPVAAGDVVARNALLIEFDR